MICDVVIHQTDNYEYPNKEDCFRPDSVYPEYIFKDFISERRNRVYEQVRETLHLAGMDSENYGKTSWNPLGGLVKSGDTVLIKPNLVFDRNISGEGTECLYTQPSVIAPIIDYVIKALDKKGHIIVGDAPMQECRFESLLRDSGLDLLIEFYTSRGISIELLDFRELKSVVIKDLHHYEYNYNVKGTVIDLGQDSEFADYTEERLNRLRITNYDPSILKLHHTKGKHEYYIADAVLKADVVINMPKPKTHKKAGTTIALKNLVGINVRKEYLPHHCIGDERSGGDEYKKKSFFKRNDGRLWDLINTELSRNNYRKASLFRFIKRFNAIFIHLERDKTREGMWYGNNTISRMTADINKIMFYADREGKMQDTIQRNYLIIADMIVTGEKNGPVAPSPRNAGIIALGYSPVCFDEAISTIMGMDIEKHPTLKLMRMMRGRYMIGDAGRPVIISNNTSWDGKELENIKISETLKLEPSPGWKNHLELEY